MQLLIKKILRNNKILKIKNFLGINPIHMSLSGIDSSASVSDAFCWRTDCNFTTTFKYSDLLNLFYNIKDSYVEIFIYSKNNDLIKKIIFSNLNFSNKLNINQELLNGIQDYGVFYIFHRLNNKTENNFILSNRCYLGFSQNNNLSSFVHGNTLAKYKNLTNDNENSDIVKTTLLINNNYRVQNYFDKFDKSEIFLSNPTSKKIKFYIKEKKFILEKGCSIIIDVTNEKEINIKSNCLFFRPLIFNYKGQYIDVYHG
jgi:hypothetical protein